MPWDTSTKTLTFAYSGNETVPTTDEHEAEAITVNVADGFTTILSRHFTKFTEMKNLNLPDTITTMGNNFLINTKIVSLYIPLNYKDVNEGQPFDFQWTLEKFTISEKHKYLTVYDDALYSKDMKTLYFYPCGKTGKQFFILNGVQTLFLCCSFILPVSGRCCYSIFSELHRYIFLLLYVFIEKCKGYSMRIF